MGDRSPCFLPPYFTLSLNRGNFRLSLVSDPWWRSYNYWGPGKCVVSEDPLDLEPEMGSANAEGREADSDFPAAEMSPTKQNHPAHHHQDWVNLLPVSEGTAFFKSINWRETTLGAPQTWPAALRFAVNLLFADSRGAAIYWGDERVAIYNNIYKPMAGQAHPNLMGKPFVVGYPELWANVCPIFEHVQATGITTDVDNIQLFTDRNGYNEETYFIGQFIPLCGDDGRVAGFYNTVYESTSQVIQVRRTAMINRIAAIPDCDLEETNVLIKLALETNGWDVPMAMLYSLDEGTLPVSQTLKLQLNIGVETNDKWIPAYSNIATSGKGVVPQFRSVYESKSVMILQEENFQKSVSLLMKDVNWSGFGESSKVLIIAPLISAGNVIGFLVMGTNPRRHFTDTCQQFTNDLTLQIAGKWASAFTVEQARAREERLVRNLAERERRIRYMAESAPVGMLHVKVNGSVAWANRQYSDLVGHSSVDDKPGLSFTQHFADNDQPVILALWNELIKSGESANCQARLKRYYHPPIEQDLGTGLAEIHPAWVLVQGFHLKDKEETELIMICFTDISGIKWAESVQSRAAAAAEKSKRQQEEFIDITSHEMRNPLSAIMQSAQAISAGLQDVQKTLNQHKLRTIDQAIEAAHTILSCGLYQKRIIDDVLLLSRLENDMLSIAPAPVNLVNHARDTLKMLDGDIIAGDIKTMIILHDSLNQLKVQNVFCDPSRLAQVLINLFSNAIKFNRHGETRLIEVTCGASLQVPVKESLVESLQWSSTGKSRADLTLFPEWGHDEVIYFYFVIRDTGSGMSQQEVDRLFTRFSQANAAIHVRHGGSGLGLYISRELIEKHGGQIGVKSEPGEGSTFGFYVKTRRAPSSSESLDTSQTDGVRFCVPVQSSDELQETEKRYSLLLVEDNLVNQRVLSRQLQKAGCVVHVANDGTEALEFLQKCDRWVDNASEGVRPSVDAILMDWNMPKLDGVSCTRLIRDFEREGRVSAPLVIIGITANARIEQIKEARDAGMDDVLSKPFLLADLLFKLKNTVIK